MLMQVEVELSNLSAAVIEAEARKQNLSVEDMVANILADWVQQTNDDNNQYSMLVFSTIGQSEVK